MGTLQGAPPETPVFPIADLKLLSAAMNNDRDFGAYLDLRQRLFDGAPVYASDEIDILSWYLGYGHAECLSQLSHSEGRFLIIAPRDVPVDLQTGRAPTRADLRRQLIALPYVDL